MIERRTARRRRLAALWALAFLLAMVAGHTLLWRWAQARLREGWDDWAAARRAQGWVIRAGQPVAGGWPVAARLFMKQVTLEGESPEVAGKVAWTAERVALSVGLLQPRVLSIVPDGAQSLQFGSWPPVPYRADRLKVEVPFEPGVQSHAAELSATSLRAGMPAPWGTAGLTVGSLHAHAELHQAALQGEPAVALNARADAIALPPDLSWTLGGRIASVNLDAALTGPVPKTSALTRRASAWRDAGGAIEVQRLLMAWGPLDLAGSATLALDPRLQPMGTGSVRITGFAETLDAVAATGAITQRAALAAKALAGLLAATPEDGGPPVIEAPITLQDRTLSIRQLPLTRLPLLSWPSG